MIGSLRGTLCERVLRSDHQAELLVEVGGIGYRVVVPAGCANRVAGPGHETSLYIHTHVREDALILYGFPTREERDCFEIVLGAHGVGPALAVALVSVLSPSALSRSVLTGDADALTLVPGIGKKTAARLVLELAPRFEAAAIVDVERGTPRGTGPEGGGDSSGDAAGPQDAVGERWQGATAPELSTQRDDVKAALVALGYAPDEVRQALARLPGDAPTPDLVRSALRELAGQR